MPIATEAALLTQSKGIQGFFAAQTAIAPSPLDIQIHWTREHSFVPLTGALRLLAAESCLLQARSHKAMCAHQTARWPS